MTTLYDALLDMARNCGITASGKTTAGGSSLYLVDTTRFEVDDYYNNGTVWIRSGDNANVTRRITDYDQSLGRVTFTPATDETVDADVYYTVTNANRGRLVQTINQALLEMGGYPTYDETLTVVNDTTEYTLPSGVRDVRRVEIITSSSAPNEFKRLYNWIENNGKLVIPKEIDETAGRTIRLYYMAYHDEVNDDTDTIRDEYNRYRLSWTATAMYLMNRVQYSGNQDERESFLLQNAMQRAQELKYRYPIRPILRDPILARW